MKIVIAKKNSFEEVIQFIHANYRYFPKEYSPKLIKSMLNKELREEILMIKLSHKIMTAFASYYNSHLCAVLLVQNVPGGVTVGEWMYVLPKFQKKGMATKLLKKWQQHSKNQKKHLLMLWSIPKYSTFYERRGFTISGEIKRAWFNLRSMLFTRNI